MNYLQGKKWSNWTRDERFFCSALYHHVKNDPSQFAGVVNRRANLSLPMSGAWDLGYEVSFYRDYLWQQGFKASRYNLSDQRAFDLCLFGEQAIVIIEAKVYEPFSASQNEVFGLDKQRLKELPNLGGIEVRLVALASSKYFENQKRFGHTGTLDMFDGRITWAELAEEYDEPLLAQADRTYKIKQGQAIE